MKIKTIKKPLLQRLLKTKYSKKQTTDNKKVIQEQDCSTTPRTPRTEQTSRYYHRNITLTLQSITKCMMQNFN